MPVLVLVLGCLLTVPIAPPAQSRALGPPRSAPGAWLWVLERLLPDQPPPIDLPPDPADLARLAPRGAPGQAVAKGKRPATEPALYLVEAAANSRQVYLLPPGPRTVRELVIEPGPASVEAWRLARLRLVWESDDPEAGAGVDLPLGLLFGQVAPGAGLGPTLLLGTRGHEWVCRFPMPYRTQALLEIRTEKPLAGRIRVRASQGFEPDAGYLRAGSWTGAPSLAEEGRGQVVGLLVVGPARAGGLVLDGQPRGPLDQAVGLRDGDDRTAEAALVRGFLRAGEQGPTARYRWLAAAPLTFERGLSVVDAPPAVVDDPASAAASATLFWYSDRPRPTPAPRDR